MDNAGEWRGGEKEKSASQLLSRFCVSIVRLANFSSCSTRGKGRGGECRRNLAPKRKMSLSQSIKAPETKKWIGLGEQVMAVRI